VDRWRGKLAWLVMAIVVVLLAAGALNRQWVMADSYRLWDDAARLLPNETIAGADRIFYNRGQAEVGRGDMKAAIEDFKRSLAVSPQHAPVHFALGWSYAKLNRFDEALVEFDEAMRLDPKLPDPYFGKGLILRIRHRNSEAAELMSRACELKHAVACVISRGVARSETK